MKAVLYLTISIAFLLQFTACEQKSDDIASGKQEAVRAEHGAGERGPVTIVSRQSGEAVSDPDAEPTRLPIDSFTEITWDDLIQEEFRPDNLLARHKKQLDELPYGDPRAIKLYEKMQAELDNAPINLELNGKPIKLGGFIAPLENSGGRVSEFLLVPFAGACIHVPPPPINQTVLVVTGVNSALENVNIMEPVWVSGVIEAEGTSTNIGEAGYRIANANVEIYEN